MDIYILGKKFYDKVIMKKVYLLLAIITLLSISSFCEGSFFCLRNDVSSHNIPYSFLQIHEETWDGMDQIVELANKYNVPLTITFWPGIVNEISRDSRKIETVHEW